jgi:hypothetical protein
VVFVAELVAAVLVLFSNVNSKKLESRVVGRLVVRKEVVDSSKASKVVEADVVLVSAVKSTMLVLSKLTVAMLVKVSDTKLFVLCSVNCIVVRAAVVVSDLGVISRVIEVEVGFTAVKEVPCRLVELMVISMLVVTAEDITEVVVTSLVVVLESGKRLLILIETAGYADV